MPARVLRRCETCGRDHYRRSPWCSKKCRRDATRVEPTRQRKNDGEAAPQRGSGRPKDVTADDLVGFWEHDGCCVLLNGQSCRGRWLNYPPSDEPRGWGCANCGRWFSTEKRWLKHRVGENEEASGCRLPGGKIKSG